MADIFISYARADRARIEKLSKALEATGYSVWWDRHIESGAEFSADIERELEAAKAVIVCWSEDGAKSRWVKDEATIAHRAGKLKTISLDGTEPPIGYMQFHSHGMSSWKGGRSEPQFLELKKSLLAHFEKIGAAKEDVAADISSPVKASWTDKLLKPIPLAAMGVAALILVGVLLWQGNRPSPSFEARPSSLAPQDEGSASGESAMVTTNTNPHPEEAQRAVAKDSDNALPPEKSIAVLPFADMSEGGDQEYFSDGMAEEILNALVKVPDLRVAGRTSSFSFKGKNVELTAIGAALNVSHILEGSVRKQGNQVRITAQLIKADDGFHLWSETYDGTLDNIFDLQEEISRAIAGELKVLLNMGEDTRLAETLTTNKQAYDLYLQGRALSRLRFGEGVMAKAVVLLEEAVALDPQFDEAWAELAIAYYQTPTFTTTRDLAYFFANAERSARRAIEIDPANLEGQLVLQSLFRGKKKFVEAREILDRLTPLGIGNAAIAMVNGYSRAAMGQTREAVPFLRNAIELEPADGNPAFSLGLALFNAGALDEAEIHMQRGLELGYLGAVGGLANVAFLRGEPERAIEHLLSGYDTFGQYYATQLRDRSLWEMVSRGFYSGRSEDREQLVAFLNTYVQSPEAIIDWPILSGYLRASEPQVFMDMFEAHPISNPEFALLNIWDDMETSRKVRQHPNFPGFAERNGLLAYWQSYGWPDLCRPVTGTDGGNGQFTCD